MHYRLSLFNKLTYRSVTRLLLIISVSISVSQYAMAEGSNSSGHVTFEHVINLHAALSPSQQAMKALIPKEQKRQVELTFSSEIYRVSEKPLEENSQQGSVRTMSFEKGISTVVNLTSSTQTRVGEIVGLTYQIQSPLASLKRIELQPESKVMLGVKVKRLTANTEIDGISRSVEIWYSPTLPVHFSPYPVNGVPGAVMAMTVEDNAWHYLATHIVFSETEDNVFAIPDSYRKITPEQLTDLREEALDALRHGALKTSSDKE